MYGQKKIAKSMGMGKKVLKPAKPSNRMAKPGITKPKPGGKMTQGAAMAKGIERAMEKFRK
jgi:hypothetical protein